MDLPSDDSGEDDSTDEEVAPGQTSVDTGSDGDSSDYSDDDILDMSNAGHSSSSELVAKDGTK